MPPLNENDCDACKILDVTACPLLVRAYIIGLDGIKRCEMKPVIDKIYYAGRAAHNSPERKAG